MARETFVFRNGQVIEKHLAEPLHESRDAGFYIQSDTMDPIRSMADRRMYDSKSRYRADLKARGMIEVGNSKVESRPTPLSSPREALRQAYNQLRG